MTGRARFAWKTIGIAVSLFVVGAMFPLAAHAAPPRRVSITDATVIEGDAGFQTVSFLISYSGRGRSGITVDYATSNGSATPGTDYLSVAGVAALPNGGCKCTTITVDVVGDLAEEATETFKVNLSAPTNALIRDGQGMGTIYDNDGPPAIAVLSAVGAEADGDVNFTIALTSPAAAPVSVDYATSDGTATAGSDYVASSGTITFLAGDTIDTVSVEILDDAVVEEHETFIIALSNAVGGTIAGAQATGTIVSDDDVTVVTGPSLSVGDVNVMEGDLGSSAVTFTLSLSEASTGIVAVDFATSDAGATAGADYVATSGTATFAPGDVVETVDVQVMGDTADEADEQFALSLSNGSDLTIADSQGIATITDDDSPAGSVATSLSLTPVRTTRRVTARGVLEPSVADLPIRVTLLVRRDGRYRRVAARTAIVTTLGDRDGDSVADAAFKTPFRRPAHGRYMLRAVFAGSSDLTRCAKAVRFRL